MPSYLAVQRPKMYLYFLTLFQHCLVSWGMAASAPKPLIIFDWDGTVANSVELIVDSWYHGLKVIGVDPLPPRNAVTATIGLSHKDAIQALVPNRDDATNAAVVEAYREHWLPRERTIPCYPDAVTVIRQLSTHATLGVATGKSRRGLDVALEVHGLKETMTTTRTADEVANGKPAPDMVRDVMDLAHVTPAQTIVVGDSPVDMQMGANAGVATCLAVDFGVGAVDDLKKAGARTVVSSWKELHQVLLEVLQEIKSS